MGIFISCCKPSASESVLTPDAETRRMQQRIAAERRVQETSNRGLKEPGKLEKLQKRQEEAEKRQQELDRQGGPTLKWQAH